MWSNFFSENMQATLAILNTVIQENGVRGGISEKRLQELIEVPKSKISGMVHTLVVKGFLLRKTDRKLYPGKKIAVSSLHDLIDAADGWFHIGNGNMKSRAVPPVYDGFIIPNCEHLIKKHLTDILSSISLPDVLAGKTEIDSLIEKYTGSRPKTNCCSGGEPCVCTTQH